MSLNDFIFGKILGKGSFGTVNIVTRKQDNKIYAMKRVNISSLSDKDKQSSLNEIRILASLNHPNIIDYKEAFFDEETKTLNIVMEYAEEGDIENKVKENLKRHLRFKEDTIWEWIIQTLEGLKYLHDNKIMHRDLKCANIFLTKNGILKLGDLNVSIIAKMGMAKTQTGTPYYCSPEIWNDRPYDYKSDIWSLGCIVYELCQLRPPFRGTNLRELSRNVIRGYYLPISSYYSNDLRAIISMMLRVDANKRASTDELLTHPILQKRIQTARKNIITREIVGKSKKVNFMETIKLPRNMKDINSKLPKKRYKPEDEMMKNDEYESTKATFYKELKELKQQINNNQNNNNGNNNLNFGYDNINMNNNRQLINNFIRKNEMPDNNGFNNYGQMNNFNNNNKYDYLNKFDNNMNLKFDEKKNNPGVRMPNNNYINQFNNMNNNNYNNRNYNIINNEKNYNYHYNEKINNNFDLLFNNNFEKKYNGNLEKNYNKNMDNFLNYNNQNKNNNGNFNINNINNGYNNNYNQNYNMNRIHPSQNNVNKYFQLVNNNNIPQFHNNRRDIIPQNELEKENSDKKSEYSNDSDIIKDEYKVKKNANLINDYFNKINIIDQNNSNNKKNDNYFNNNNNYENKIMNNKKNDAYNFDYNKKNNIMPNGNENKNINYEKEILMNKFNDESNGIKEHEIEKELENDKTKDLQQQMIKNQNLFDDLLNIQNNEKKMNIGENELFRINIPQNNNQEKNNIDDENDNLTNKINLINQNLNNIKNNFNNHNKNNDIVKSEIIDLKGLDLNNLNIFKNNENGKNKLNQNKKKVNTEIDNGNNMGVKMLLQERFHKNQANRKNNNYNRVGKNVKKDIKRQVTPNHIYNNKKNNIQYSYNNNQINNNINKQNNKNSIPVKNNNNKKEEDKYKKKFNEIYEMFPGHNKIKHNKNFRPQSGKPKNLVMPKNNINNMKNDYSNNNNRIRNNNINNNNYINYQNENNNMNYRMNNHNYNINYNNNNINNYNNIYINNINGNDKLDYDQLFNNKNNNIKYSYNPAINNNKGYIVKSEQMNNNYQIYNNNYNNNKFEFKFEPVKRQNNKISYEKYNYNEYLIKNNMNKNYGIVGQKNNLNDLYQIPNMRKDNYNNINISNKYDNKKNKNINRKIIKNQNSNKPRVKTGGGANNELYKKFGFL